MASKFKIFTYRNPGTLYLKLIGEFDGSSTWHLIEKLRKNADEFHSILINTDSLGEIYPFGVHIFHQELKALRRYKIRVLFTGEKADQISPEEKLCMYCDQDYTGSKIAKRQGMI
ncbi:MAG: hypothetical protein RBT11_12715 [Desulfobacterales bacterium]|jgi:hypothetical protein|nr:hypothetical protein [Desulfobacterales bacterium]